MRAWLLALPLLLACACEDKPSASGTKTHWLVDCTDSTDCPDGAICRCGLCELPLVEDLDLESAVPATCAAGGLICESFDSPLPAHYSTWHGLDDGLDATLQGCDVHSGAGAVRYDASTFGYTQTRMRLPEEIDSGPLYARVYAYLPSTKPIPEYLILLELWDEEHSDEFKIALEVMDGDKARLVVGPAAGLGPETPAGSLPRDEWVCLELGLDVAETNGTATLSINGTELVNETGITTRPPGPVEVLSFGAVPPPESDPEYEVVMDELVVATEPIGCR